MNASNYVPSNAAAVEKPRTCSRNQASVSQATEKFWQKFYDGHNPSGEDFSHLFGKYLMDEVYRAIEDEVEKNPEHYINDGKLAVKAAEAILEKRYDTNSARLIGSYSCSLPSSECENHDEYLYQREDGSYFLLLKDGAASDSCVDGISVNAILGERFFPIEASEAKMWLKKYCSDKSKEVAD